MRSSICAGLAGVLGRAEATRQPIAVSFAVTERCDRRCEICYLPTRGDRRELSTAEVQAALRALKGLGSMFLALTGGEPTLRDDLLDIVGAARDLGFAVELLTHGGRIDDRLARSLAHKQLLAAHVTLFSAEATLHDRICGVRGAFRETVRGIKALRSAGVEVVVATPLLKESFAGRHRVEELAHDLGAAWISDPTISPRDDGDLSPVSHRLDDSELAEYLAENPLPIEDTVERGPGALCAAGERTLHVDPDGSLRPCIQDPRVLGSVLAADLHRIWEQDPVLQELRVLGPEDLRGACASCAAHRWCGRCGALALLEDGDPRGPWRWACRQAELARTTRC